MHCAVLSHDCPPKEMSDVDIPHQVFSPAARGFLAEKTVSVSMPVFLTARVLAKQVTMLLVANNALQGILSSFFYKFADTILKKYSSTMATIFTAFVSAAAFGHKLTLNFLIGVSIVFISMHQFMAHGELALSPSP